MSAPMSAFVVKMCFLNKLVILNTFLPFFVRSSSVQYHSGLYGTKTNYANSYAGDKNVIDHGFTESNIQEIREKFPELSDIPGCKPIHVNGLFRHGTRYPSNKDARRVDTALEKIRKSKIDRELLARIDSTALILTNPKEKSLARAGVLELNGIGTRFGQRFGELYDDCKDGDILFETTSKSRALDSGKAFRETFSKTLNPNMKMPKFQIRDDILRSYDNCSDYMRFVEEDPSYMFEYKEFRRNKFQDLSKKIAVICGQDISFTDGEIKSMWVFAGIEKAVLGTNHWGSLFDLDDMFAEEYAGDLKSYWKRSYGHRLSFEHICPLLKDFFVHMDDAVIGYKYKKGVFRFAHAETVIPLLTILGLHNDSEPLLGSDFPGRTDRLFRTSAISPFSANLAFVLYYCDPDFDVGKAKYSSHLSLPPSYDRYMVQLLQKEIPIKFPFSKYDLAKYEDVKLYYKKFIKNCDFTEICGNPPRSNEDHEITHDEL